MEKPYWNDLLESIDDRRDLIVPGNNEQTLDFCANHFVHLANEAIAARGFFSVALSGGSTPKAIYERLTQSPFVEKLDWKRILFFWSDERSVSPEKPESNYRMAMEAGLKRLTLPPEHVFRMHAEEQIEENAREYEKHISNVLPGGVFDLVMLGLGEDGHTASLFPYTHALKVEGRLAVANYVPKLSTWRMTLTYDCINAARHCVFYVLGANKRAILKQIFFSSYDPDQLPAQKIGISAKKALWITDIPQKELVP